MQRIIQELVPGKQITLAHIIANPDPSLFASLSPVARKKAVTGSQTQTAAFKPAAQRTSAVGIINVTPPETAVIAADLAVKSAGVSIISADRVSGSLIVTGTVSEVESAFAAVIDYVENILKYEICQITKT